MLTKRQAYPEQDAEKNVRHLQRAQHAWKSEGQPLYMVQEGKNCGINSTGRLPDICCQRQLAMVWCPARTPLSTNIAWPNPGVLTVVKFECASLLILLHFVLTMFGSSIQQNNHTQLTLPSTTSLMKTIFVVM